MNAANALVRAIERLLVGGTLAVERGAYAIALRRYHAAKARLGRRNGARFSRLRARALTAIGALFCRRGDFAGGRRALDRALSILERNPAGNEGLLVETLNALGMHGKYTARFDEAARFYRRALELARTCGGDWRAVLYHNLGGLEHARGRHRRGIRFARRGVELRRKSCDEHDPRLALDLAALGALLADAGDDREAERLFLGAVRVFRRARGPLFHEAAVSYSNLGSLYHACGRWTRAERMYREALSIKEKVWGRRHPSVAMTLNNLAVLLAKRGRTKEAAALYRRAIRIFTATFGATHPHTEACRANEAALR